MSRYFFKSSQSLFALTIALVGGCQQSATATVTADELCEAYRGCATTLDHETCVTQFAPTIAQAERAGCTAEVDATTQCMIDLYSRAAEEGTCDSVRFGECTAAAEALTTCLRNAG